MTSITTLSTFAHRLWIIPKERRFDLHCAAEELAGPRLQNRIDRVLDDHWIGSCRLRRVKGVFGGIDGRERFGFVDEPLDLGITGFGSKHRDLDVWLQRFPGLMA